MRLYIIIDGISCGRWSDYMYYNMYFTWAGAACFHMVLASENQ